MYASLRIHGSPTISLSVNAAYSATISALSKGQQWEKALELFRELEASGSTPSIVTYNATMTALEKGLQWERALDLFDEMKSKDLPVTVVSYGSAISACEKGLQYRQCLEYLDEMTQVGIKKNVIIFGAAMSCMEKCSRADIGFQLMERMKIEEVSSKRSHLQFCHFCLCPVWPMGKRIRTILPNGRSGCRSRRCFVQRCARSCIVSAAARSSFVQRRYVLSCWTVTMLVNIYSNIDIPFYYICRH